MGRRYRKTDNYLLCCLIDFGDIIFYYLQGAWENCIGIYDENVTKQGKRYANTPCAIDPFPEHSKAKTGLLTGSVSRLAGRELFTKASSMNLDKILIPVTTI